VAVVDFAEEAVDFADAAAQLGELEVLRLEVGQCTDTDHSYPRLRPFGRCGLEGVLAVEEARHVECLSMSDWVLAEAAAEVLHEVPRGEEMAWRVEQSVTALR
jgi:hypothetical protein